MNLTYVNQTDSEISNVLCLRFPRFVVFYNFLFK